MVFVIKRERENSNIVLITKNKKMKKQMMTVAIVLLAATLMTTSCVGSFSLFNTVLSWNKKATDSKFLNELIFIICTPVYSICSGADLFVLNAIEFWTGDNPLANVGKTKQVMGQDGKYYAVKTLKNGYEITNQLGEKTLFVYNKKDNSWLQVVNGKQIELFRINGNGTACVTLPNGKQMNVAMNQAGLYKVRMAANGGTYWAMR